MLVTLPNEILLDIIDYLPFDDTISLFKINSVKNLLDRKVRDKKLYQALFLKVTRILGLPYLSDKESYIRDYGNIIPCKREIVSLIKRNLGKYTVNAFISVYRKDCDIYNDSDDDVIWYMANECDDYLKGYKNIDNKINVIFNLHVYKTLETKNPKEITSYIIKTYNDERGEENRYETYLVGIKEILSLDC